MSDNLNSAVDHTPEVDEDEADENIISLTDDQGRTSEYMILDAIDTQEGKFVALLPLASIDEETGDGEYYILQVMIVDNEEELAEIDDKELLMALDDLFRERFGEIYGNAQELSSPDE
jgi:Protein of unknown function (DUF1292).